MDSDKIFSLDFNKTRQVSIKIDSSKNTEDIRLMANGIEYTHNCKSGDYAGCGIDAAHSFMGWFKDDIPRSAIKKKVETLEVPGFPIPTTPAQMSVGLEKLVKQTVKNRKSLENNIIRHTKGTDAEVIAKIRHHLRRGMPVVALINAGNHWVTVVGIKCKYTSTNEIDVNKTKVTYIDVTNSWTYTNIPYKNLKILHWKSVLNWQGTAGEFFASSYKTGTVISLKSDSILYGSSWNPGWNGDIYSVNGKNYLFLLKESNGLVHIHKIKSDGSVGSRIFKENWTKGWSNINFYTVNKQTYLFLMKAGSGSGYTNGLVHIHKVNSDDGTIGKKIIKEYDWSAGWRNIEFFSLKNKTYLLLNKRDGQTHIHEIKSDGTVKSPAVLTTKSFIKMSGNIQSVEAKNEVNLYGVQSYLSSKNGLYSQYRFYNKDGKFRLELVETRKWTKNWTDINIFKNSAQKSFFITYKGTLNKTLGTSGRNGIMHIHEIKDLKDGSFKGKLGKLVDDNYYRNKITEMWTNIKYFRATNGKLKLFLLDKFSGRVRVMNMQKDGGFEKQLTVSEPTKPIKSYIFYVRTSDIKKAGTNAKVFITLKGKNWVSPEYQIDTICNDFEKDSTVIHAVPVDKYFGKITEIIVRHDNSGKKAGWHLNNIRISESTTNKNWKFVSNQWFATSVGDRKIKRILSVSK